MSGLITNPDPTHTEAARVRSNGLDLSPAASSMTSRKALGIVMALTAIIFLICCAIPRISQPQSYHQFADQRSFLGIPNFGDVISNLAFALIGLWGLIFLFQSHISTTVRNFLDKREIWPYLFVFAGLLLTAFGSSYYHLAPDNARLVWDRLPMTVTFMAMVAAVISERINLQLGLRLLPILLLLGLASVLQWYWSEARGMGDLRFYAAVQVYSALVILLALLLPKRYSRSADFGLIFAFYAIAKIFELFDVPIFAAIHVVSGHTLKHLAAAAAGFCILRMLQKRTPVAAQPATFTAGSGSAVPLDSRSSVL